MHRARRFFAHRHRYVRDGVRERVEHSLFEEDAHHPCRRWMIEDDEGIAVARRFERVDERIAFFDEEPVVHASMTSVTSPLSTTHPLGELAGHFPDGDLVVVRVP